MYKVCMLGERIKFSTAIGPNEADVIYVSHPDQRFVWKRSWKPPLHGPHEETGVCWAIAIHAPVALR